ncbi:uncharacterized protein [Arachis hypogaea]|uniref:uncharacterized protein n=1 Tax=Arachis hypogaea TaxID=3818 RepID=UPI000DEC7580|nr:uncharacterized protein LOC112756005 [Arachis hypogaea]QHN88646.1 uncharacterized protein DS421_16g565240 [Arachis hypogaea]
MDFGCSDASIWKEALSAYPSRIESLSLTKNKPNLLSLDQFYTKHLPSLLQQRNPNPFLTTTELSDLMRWKLTRGKWRPRLLEFVEALDDVVVRNVSEKAFRSLPDLKKAVSEICVLKGVGPATASAVLAAYAPQVAPFMSDEAMEAALGNSKDYTLKQYLIFADKCRTKQRN